MAGKINSTAQPILGASGNMIGFCLVVITSFHFTGVSTTSIIDEITAATSALFTISCLFAFFSIKSDDSIKKLKYETIAEYLFIISLFLVLAIISFITFSLIK